MKPLISVMLATMLSGSICTPKPEKSDIATEQTGPEGAYTVPEESATPDGERAGSGFW